MRLAARRPLPVRMLGSLLLVAGAVLMALSATGRGAAALGKVAPPSLPTAVGSAVCDATGRGGPAGVLPAGRCREEDDETQTTTSCSTTEEESERAESHHREDPGRAAATATTTQSTGRALAAARTTTATESPGPASLAAGVSGASSVPATGVKAAAASGPAPTRAPVTTIPVTGASAPFGPGLALGIAGLGLIGLSSRRRRS